MTFRPGDRVQTRYGPGTVTEAWPNDYYAVTLDGHPAPDSLYAADILTPLAEEQLRLEPDGFADWVEQLPDRGQAT